MDQTVALAGNFVDSANWQVFIDEIREMSQVDAHSNDPGDMVIKSKELLSFLDKMGITNVDKIVDLMPEGEMGWESYLQHFENLLS